MHTLALVLCLELYKMQLKNTHNLPYLLISCLIAKLKQLNLTPQ